MMPTTMPMPMTQPTMTMQLTTMTKPTANTMPSNPARSTVNTPTLHKLQQLPQTTTNTIDAAKDDFPTMISMTMMQPLMPTTTYNTMTEKMKTSNTPATASTFHKPQLWLQSIDDDEDNIGDNFPMPLPTMILTKPTTKNTKQPRNY